MNTRDDSEDTSGANDFFENTLTPEITTIVFANIPPPELERLSTVSREFRLYANDSHVWRASLKTNFGIECNSEMTLPKFTRALREQQITLWDTYKDEFYITPCPVDANAAYLKNLFENPEHFYKTHWSDILMGLPYAIEVASARGMEEM